MYGGKKKISKYDKLEIPSIEGDVSHWWQESSPPQGKCMDASMSMNPLSLNENQISLKILYSLASLHSFLWWMANNYAIFDGAKNPNNCSFSLPSSPNFSANDGWQNRKCIMDMFASRCLLFLNSQWNCQWK